MAPEVRACSFPFLNSTRVGMLMMLKRAASACSFSVLTFTSLTPGWSCRAACTKTGAIILQGPHQACPEINQQRNVAVPEMALEALGV
jgi:hypothetical protein